MNNHKDPSVRSTRSGLDVTERVRSCDMRYLYKAISTAYYCAMLGFCLCIKKCNINIDTYKVCWYKYVISDCARVRCVGWLTTHGFAWGRAFCFPSSYIERWGRKVLGTSTFLSVCFVSNVGGSRVMHWSRGRCLGGM